MGDLCVARSPQSATEPLSSPFCQAWPLMGYKSFSDATTDASEQTNFFFLLVFFTWKKNLLCFPLNWAMDGFHLPAFAHPSLHYSSVIFLAWFLSRNLWQSSMENLIRKKTKTSNFDWFFNVDPKHISALKLMFFGYLITFHLIMQNILLEFGFFSLVMVEYYLKLNLDHFFYSRIIHRKCTNKRTLPENNYINSFW